RAAGVSGGAHLRKPPPAGPRCAACVRAAAHRAGAASPAAV
nr:hypothetical protein [Tanacetum cinerariifolium]